MEGRSSILQGERILCIVQKPEGRKVCNTFQEIAAGMVTQCTTLRSASPCKNAAGLTTVFHTFQPLAYHDIVLPALMWSSWAIL